MARYRDILDNRDNCTCVVNIEIKFVALSHTSIIYIYIPNS